MNDVEVYNRMHDMAGFEQGDKIRLVRLWAPEEFNTKTMPASRHRVGEVYTVKSAKDAPLGAGFRKMLIVKEGGFMPFFAVELVEKKPKWQPLHISLNSNYTAVVHHDKVVVGCQEFSFAAIENLAKTVAAAKAPK